MGIKKVVRPCCLTFILGDIMVSKRLKLCYISEDYINYLRKFDKKVCFNKNNTRPYVGIVYAFGKQKYFAPLSSPKPKHKWMDNSTIDIWLIDGGKLGMINFNNMIPTPSSELSDVVSIIEDIKYKKLLENQLTLINRRRNEIIKKCLNFRYQYDKKRLSPNIMNRCCNFKMLEKKCYEYMYLKRKNQFVKKLKTFW